MQSNNNNNEQNWRQRLDEFEAYPSHDLNMSWEKLQQRSPVKKNNSRKLFYWLSAAAALLIAVFTLIFTNDKTVKATDPFIVKKDTLKTLIENKAIVIENKTAIVKPIIVLQKDEIISPKEKQVVLKTKPAAEEIILVTTMSEEPGSNLVIDTSAKSTVAEKIQPKKLKLIHINAIDPPANDNGLAQQEGRPYFPVNYPSKQVYTNAENDKKSKDNLIRIRLN